LKAKTKAEAVKIAREKAHESMTNIHSCSQSTVLALQEAFGLQDENVLKGSGSLTGGVGGLNETCGSLLGASIMYGVVFGRGYSDLQDKDKLNDSMAETGKLLKWYEKEFGSSRCRDICTRFGGGTFYDRNVPWQFTLMEEAGIHNQCDVLAQKTAARAAEVIWDYLHKKDKN
jgi:C_GCAxxG_C_C family probable redox protein